MTLLVTGAAGFVGSAVSRALAETEGDGKVRLFDRTSATLPGGDRFEIAVGDLTDDVTLERVLDGVTCVIHLASLPGGSAEADPVLSRRVNLDATLRIGEWLAAKGGAQRPRLVFASSIAVLGQCGAPVDDRTLPAPTLTYGAHKWMAEIGLADLHRRGGIDVVTLRLPAVVARPGDGAGLKSAFISTAFHAGRAGRPFTFPVSPSATMWLMSAHCAARNLLHATRLADPSGAAFTLPALRVSAEQLAQAVFADSTLVTYAPEPDLEAAFGSYPTLATPLADKSGFHHDGDLASLVEAALR